MNFVGTWIYQLFLAKNLRNGNFHSFDFNDSCRKRSMRTGLTFGSGITRNTVACVHVDTVDTCCSILVRNADTFVNICV